MPELLIQCPTTKKPVGLGLDMPKGAITPGSFTDNTTSCPHCNKDHKWSDQDVYFDGDPPKTTIQE